MEVPNTRLRFISAVDPMDLSMAVNGLPFKVEIKGSPTFDGSKWFVWFILPEDSGIKLENIDLG